MMPLFLFTQQLPSIRSIDISKHFGNNRPSTEKNYELMPFLIRIAACALLTLFLCSDLQAQLLNVERVRGEADETGWTGDLGFNFSVNRYQDRVLKVANSANTSYNTINHTYLFLTNLELVNVDGSSLISSGYFHLRSTLLRNRTVSPEMFLQYQYNNNLGLNNRALAGSGVRVELVADRNFSGHIQTGFMYEYEEWEVADAENVERGVVKSTSNISFIGDINPQTSLLFTGYYQARPNRFFKPRAILESQLTVQMGRFVSLAVSFTMQHDAEPVIDVPRLTYELKNGLLISF
jgi:hypothetical protein